MLRLKQQETTIASLQTRLELQLFLCDSAAPRTSALDSSHIALGVASVPTDAYCALPLCCAMQRPELARLAANALWLIGVASSRCAMATRTAWR